MSDVLSVENGQLIVKDHADLDHDTLSTVAEVTEVVNDKGYRTLRVSPFVIPTMVPLSSLHSLRLNRIDSSSVFARPSSNLAR
jgi:hypothetical protein